MNSDAAIGHKEPVTPAFVVDEEDLRRNVEALQGALERHWENAVIGYSYKTNSLPWLLKFMQDRGCYAEAVSDTEYALAERMGYQDRIILNGPVKGRECFTRALSRKNIVNIDSWRELEWLLEHGTEGIRASVGLRVNFDLEKECPGETVAGDGGSRFGFCVENGELEKAAGMLGKAGIGVQGLHMHTSTRSRSAGIFRALSAKAVSLARSHGWELSYLDIGGGFFAGGDKRDAYEEYIRVIAGELRSYAGPDKLRLIIEPGAALIASPVSYVTQVTDLKDTVRRRYVVTDGSRLHIDPFLAKERYPYRIVAAEARRAAPDKEKAVPVQEAGGQCAPAGMRRQDNKEAATEQVICGFTCMEKDRLMVLDGEGELGVGDRIIYECVGSYTMSLAPLFIQYYPRVYVKGRTGLRLVREEWGVEEYLQKNEWE